MKKTYGTVVSLVVMLTLSLVGTSAFAGSGQGQRGGACAQDIANFCGEVESRREAKQCLMEHRGELSEACEARIEKREKKAAVIKNACSADVQNHCSGLEGKELRKCMKANKDNLSETCSEALKGARKHKRARKNKKARRAVKAACGEEIKTYCGDVERGEGRIKQCIASHMDDFSDSCVSALETVRAKRR